MKDEIIAAEESYNVAASTLISLYEARLAQLAGGGAPARPKEFGQSVRVSKEVVRDLVEPKQKAPSRKTLASRKLQVRYIAFSRSLNQRDKAKLSRLTKESGRETAMESMAKELRGRERAKRAKAKEDRLVADTVALAKKLSIPKARKRSANERAAELTRRLNRSAPPKPARRAAAKRILADITPDAALAADSGTGDIQ
jgi:hypothetical protein